MRQSRSLGLMIAGIIFIPLLIFATVVTLVYRRFEPDTPAEPPLTLAAEDDFETFRMDWQLGHGWAHVPSGDSSMVLRASNADQPTVYGDHVFGDVAIHFLLRVEEGQAAMSFRQSSAGSYTVTLNPAGELKLYRSGTLLADASLEFDATSPRWHLIQVSAIGAAVQVSIDHAVQLAVEDGAAAPLPPGTINFWGIGLPLRYAIDDFSVWVPASAP